MTILVIDDEAMIRDIAKRILIRAEYDVLLAESGEDGLVIIQKEPDLVQLVILDYSLEGMTGPETLRVIRQISPKLPAIFSSGHLIELDNLPPELAKQSSILQKPYRAAELVNAVEAALS